MPASKVSLVRRRQVGRILREMRERAGLTHEQAAAHLDCSPAKLSRVENAVNAIDVHLVKSMLDLYDVGGDRWTEVLELTRAARQKGWWRAYGVSDQGYVPLEAEANAVWNYTCGYVPGLLQTPEYVRVLFQASIRSHTEATVERAVQIRAVRQRRLTAEDHPLDLAAIVDESVLLRPFGGPTVMRAQLAHLVEAAGWRRVTLQVLPLAAGASAGVSGEFSVLSFGELGEPDMAYVEHACGADHVEKPEEVARAKLRFDRLRSEALSPADSVALIERVAADL